MCKSSRKTWIQNFGTDQENDAKRVFIISLNLRKTGKEFIFTNVHHIKK